jgi:NTE family protein
VGIALSGGAFRGMAHIGVLKALEEKGIRPSIISASSAGAIIGALYAAGYSPKELEKLALKTNFIPYLKPNLPLQSLMSLEKLSLFLANHIGRKDISELEKKLFICVTNLNSGSAEYLSEGDLCTAVTASSAMPFIFAPVKINDSLYVDGGVMNNLPVEPLIRQSDFLIGVNVNPVGKEEKFTNLFAILVRSFFLAIRSNTKTRVKYCDLYIQPPELTKVWLFSAGRIKETIRIGYDYTKNLDFSLKATSKSSSHTLKKK